LYSKRPKEFICTTLAIRTDEATGLKVFNTRAAKATDKIAAKGYSAIEDEALKTLPAPPPGAVFENRRNTARSRKPDEARPITSPWKASSPNTFKMSTRRPRSIGML
jgi:hypothetical protein